MIDWLRTTKSANFYKKRKRLPKKAIADLFRDVRERYGAVSRNIFHYVKEGYRNSFWSAIAFPYERDPSFLEAPEGQEIKERICGFLFVVEHRDHVVIFKSGLDLPSDFKTAHLRRVGDQSIEGVIAQVNATFEQIRLRNMTTSKHTLRSKTLEANNLQNVIGFAGANRYIAKGYRVQQNGAHLTGTPNTGRISLRSDKVPYQDLIVWAETCIDTLNNDAPVLSPFIRAFARPIDLESMPANLLPTFIAFDVPQLTEDIFEAPEEIRLVRGKGDDAEPLDKDATEVVLAALDQNFVVQKVRSDLVILDPRTNAPVGNLNITKSRISLRKLDLPEIEEIYVEPTNSPEEQNNLGIALKRHIDHHDLFAVLFNELAVVYMDGTLYRDSNLTDGQAFLSHLRADAQLGRVTSEKGAFAVGQTQFDANSIFAAIVNNISDRDELLACDDLGDEWADFIGVNDSSRPKSFSFYHAKHGPITLGASEMHVAVSQAIKNLGRLNPSDEEIEAKLQKWRRTYNSGNVETAIERIIRAGADVFQQNLTRTLLSPDTIRRVFIITSALSLRQLEAQFADIRAGNPPLAHFVQLYWLLTSFFSACNEVNANGYVICQA